MNSGKIEEVDKIKFIKSDQDVMVVGIEDCEDEMLYDLEHGKEKGSTTHIKELDSCWKWRHGEFNIWTGYNNEGKSTFLRYLAVIKMIMSGWKFIFSAPEDFPPKKFFDDMIHMITGKSTDRDNAFCVSKEEYKRAIDILRRMIKFVYLKPPKNTILQVFGECEKVMQDFDAQGVVLDPLIKFARPPEAPDRDDLYAQYVTTMGTDFARKHNISLSLVMHQLTPKALDNGNYPKPTSYSIKGGGTWSDGVDNVLSIWRPYFGKEKLRTEVMFTSQKIKEQKLVGLPQDFNMNFDRRSNRFISQTGHQLFDFDKIINK